jgi:fused signal recognition particle receptor
MESLDLNNPTVLAAIAAVAALIAIGIIVGLVRGRKKQALPQEPPPPPPEALSAERPKIDVGAEAEPTQPLQLEDLVPPGAPPPAPSADLGAFRSGLESTRGNLISRLAGVFRRDRELDTSILDEVEEVLITADVGVHTTSRILEALRTRMNGGKLSSADDAWQAIRKEATSILASSGQGLAVDQTPTVILVVGVNGVGKTTTIGKLASRFDRQGKSLLLAAGDTFRAAAVTQLEVWGRRVGCEVVKGKDRADPGSVIFDAIEKAKGAGTDIVIADTAGRLHTKVPLMDELKKLGRTVEKALGRPADHVLLVLDATTGQNAIQQVQLFKEALGVGEKVEDLKPFATEAFLEALFESPEALEPSEEAASAG